MKKSIVVVLLCLFIVSVFVFRPRVLRENHGGGGGHGGGGHGGGGHGGGGHGWGHGWGRGGGGHGWGHGWGRGGHGWGHRGWTGGWGGGSYAVNPLYVYDDDDNVYYSYPYYFF